MSKQKSSLSKHSPPLVQPHPFQKEYFIPTLIGKLEELIPSFVQGGGGFELYGFLKENSPFSIFGQKGFEMGQKQGFFCFLKKVVISFYWNCVRMKDDIVGTFLTKNPISSMIVLELCPKILSTNQDFLNFNILKIV